MKQQSSECCAGQASHSYQNQKYHLKKEEATMATKYTVKQKSKMQQDQEELDALVNRATKLIGLGIIWVLVMVGYLIYRSK